MHNINSGEEYANLIINDLNETKPETDLPEVLFEYWKDNIKTLAIDSYNEYIIGNKDSYMLDEDDVMDAYKEAMTQFTQHILNGLSDKGLVQVGINSEGEIVYSLTEDGKSCMDKIK